MRAGAFISGALLSRSVVRIAKPSTFALLSTATSAAPSPSPTEPSLLRRLFAKQLAFARRYGPPLVGVWSALYLGPGLAAYQLLALNDNFGLSLDALAAYLPPELVAWILEMMRSVSGAEVPPGPAGATPALSPWQTSAVLAWASTEAIEPVRFPLSLLIVRLVWGAEASGVPPSADGSRERGAVASASPPPLR